ncbi:MAG: hypothetical protein CMH83_08075 [Nocardioides sp.]|nr:hypothetical protein [Nocardioides sp.]
MRRPALPLLGALAAALLAPGPSPATAAGETDDDRVLLDERGTVRLHGTYLGRLSRVEIDGVGGDWRVDLDAGTLEVDGTSSVLRGFTGLDVRELDWASLTVRGTTYDDSVALGSPDDPNGLLGRPASISLLGGDDAVYVGPGVPPVLRLGPGEDLLHLTGRSDNATAPDVAVDLPDRRLEIRLDGVRRTSLLAAVESVTARQVARLTFVGDGRANELVTYACHVSARLGGGPDQFLGFAPGYLAEPEGYGYKGCPTGRTGAVVRGGGGNDRLLGTHVDDVLVGGGGRDRLDGRNGTDTCRQARTYRRCEIVPGR